MGFNRQRKSDRLGRLLIMGVGKVGYCVEDQT